MEIGGRQWLWKSDIIPFAPPQEGTSYVETADSGGFDECFPTVGACRIPGWVRGWGGVELPDHGEVWSQLPEMDIDTTDDGQAVVTTWEGRRLPYRLTRLARVSRAGAVVHDVPRGQRLRGPHAVHLVVASAVPADPRHQALAARRRAHARGAHRTSW